jgi:hypothetical protein
MADTLAVHPGELVDDSGVVGKARLVARLACVAVLLGVPLAAHAQEAEPVDRVAAETLSGEAHRLVAAGDYEMACPKFAESQQLDPSPSTLLDLADCWKRSGRLAMAWATYKQAESAAIAARRPDYATTAQRHATTLESAVARLTLHVTKPVEGIRVTRDGVVTGPSSWDTPLPVDRGPHTIEASAPRFAAWSSRVEITSDGASVTVTVPSLEALPTPPPAPLGVEPTRPSALGPLPPISSRGGSQRLASSIVGSAGVLALGATGVLGIVADNKNLDSRHDCPVSFRECGQAGVSEREDAMRTANAATVTFFVGAGLLAAGAVLWFTAPAAKDAPANRTGVAFAPTPSGGALEGRW